MSETPLDSDAIRARMAYPGPIEWSHAQDAFDDRADLIAEVERLRTENERLTTAYGWLKTESMFLLGKMLGGIVADAQNAEQRVESVQHSVEALRRRIEDWTQAYWGEVS